MGKKLTPLVIPTGLAASTPAAGTRALYPKSDGWYEKDSSGTEAKVGAATAVTQRTVTDNTTLVLADGGGCVEVNNAAAKTVTVPTNASVAFPVGTLIEVCQLGAGQVTIAPAGGVTLRNSSSLLTRTQYSSLMLRKRATDEWVVSGDAQ